MINTRPTDCNCCGGKNTVVFTAMADRGIKPFESGYCYYCDNCGAYVGTHKGRTKDALGILSDGKTRALRALCHEEFNKHFMMRSSKNILYYKLATEMDIPYENCHFGYMKQAELEKALEIMRGWGDFFVR